MWENWMPSTLIFLELPGFFFLVNLSDFAADMVENYFMCSIGMHACFAVSGNFLFTVYGAKRPYRLTLSISKRCKAEIFANENILINGTRRVARAACVKVGAITLKCTATHSPPLFAATAWSARWCTLTANAQTIRCGGSHLRPFAHSQHDSVPLCANKLHTTVYTWRPLYCGYIEIWSSLQMRITFTEYNYVFWCHGICVHLTLPHPCPMPSYIDF